jgi:carbonic anhydrase
MSALLRNLRQDVPASIVVFLVAIPLSLGIAAASGAPLMAGLIAGVVGGIVAGALGGAPMLVSGPAAGLTVIVAGTIASFGMAGTAVIVALAGLVQIVLGLSRLGRAALALSPAVVHGMLAGIGVVITLGQVHVVLGGSPASSAWHNLRELPGQIADHHGVSLALGLLVIALMLIWPRLVKTSLLPSALVAVVAATGLAAALDADVKRVELPSFGLTFPQWPDGPAHEIAIAVVTIALVAGVESLLSAVAVDKLHDGPRANLDRELIAQGAANTVTGLLGGLPVTGVIVRSSANVAAGARTRASAILHGVWIAVFVLLAAGLLEMIPLSALAAVLIVVGLKLISPAQIRTYARHRELPAYLVTAVGVVATDLLTGVALGLGVAALTMVWRLARCEVRAASTAADGWRVTITGTLAFICTGRLARGLAQVPPGVPVVVELHLDYLDHGAFAALRDWQEAHTRSGGTVTIREMRDGWFGRALDGRLGAQRSFWTPWHSWTRWQERDAMNAGLRDFERHVAPFVQPQLSDLVRDGQSPSQLFITCADSRLVPNLITASGPGDLFCVRNVGNIVPPASSADASVGAAIEYAVTVLGVRTITVCGHSDCGGVRALMSGSASASSSLGRWLSHAGTHFGPASEPEGCAAHVRHQLDNLRTYPAVREALAAGDLTLTGMYFDLAEARMHRVGDLPPERSEVASTVT